MCRIHNFIFRLKRAFSWFVFSFKQDPWQEDYQLFETIEKVLLDTANYFEKRQEKGYVVSVNNKADIQDMRLAAKLIKMRMSEHYFEKCDGDFKELIKASETDNRALQIAMNIISQKGFNWWI